MWTAGYSKTISSSRGSGPEGVFDDKELLSNISNMPLNDQRIMKQKSKEWSGSWAML
jgi:hypothetical protein